MKKTFCPLPWTIVSAQPSGIMRVCSPSHSTPNRGVLRKKNGSLYRFGKATVSEAKNADLLKTVRLNMLENKETPEVCQRCISDEESGVNSRRQIENNKNMFSIHDALQLTNSDGSLNSQITKTLDLRFGNTCNLSCRMCSPAASSGWYSEYYETRFKRFTDGDEKHELIRNSKNQVHLKKDIYGWVNDSKVWDDLILNIRDIRELHFSGGEPFLIIEHYKLLEQIIESGRADQVSLDYNSNITILPKRLLELWKSFKSVSIGASVDAIGALNNYIRYPSDFSIIEKHLDQLDASDRNIHVWLSTTVQALNIFALTDLYKWLLEKRFKKINYQFFKNEKKLFLSSHTLHSPAYLGIKILPPDFKLEIEKKFNDFIEWYNLYLIDFDDLSDRQKIDFKAMMTEHLNSILKFMKTEDYTHLLPHFLKEMQASDIFRNQNTEQILPELTQSITRFLNKN